MLNSPLFQKIEFYYKARTISNTNSPSFGYCILKINILTYQKHLGGVFLFFHVTLRYLLLYRLLSLTFSVTKQQCYALVTQPLRNRYAVFIFTRGDSFPILVWFMWFKPYFSIAVYIIELFWKCDSRVNLMWINVNLRERSLDQQLN